MFAAQDNEKPDTEITKGLSLAVIKCMAIQVTTLLL
jgi:hypothetical protein